MYYMYLFLFLVFNNLIFAFSALTLLVGWQEGHPACKNWLGAGMLICLEQGADLHMARLMPLPLTVSCFSKIQIGFTFLVLLLLHVMLPCVSRSHQMYYMFGFLFLVFIILIVTCSETAILLCYFHLCAEVSVSATFELRVSAHACFEFLMVPHGLGRRCWSSPQ